MKYYAKIINEETKECEVINQIEAERLGWQKYDLEFAHNGNWYVKGYAPTQPLDELKKAKLTEAGSVFAQKRDARRFIQLDENRYYGFDCASEDITNFLARWTPLAMMGGGESQYKVWLNETEKDLVMLSLADYNLVYEVVSESQLEAYDWYKLVQTQVKACTTKEELEAIVL